MKVISAALITDNEKQIFTVFFANRDKFTSRNIASMGRIQISHCRKTREYKWIISSNYAFFS